MAEEKIQEKDAKLGKRIKKMLLSSKEIKPQIKALEKICDKVYEKGTSGGWEKDMIMEWAYTGCVLSALCGGDPVPRLKAYVQNVKDTLAHNEYSDPAFYVPEIYNVVFKK